LARVVFATQERKPIEDIGSPTVIFQVRIFENASKAHKTQDIVSNYHFRKQSIIHSNGKSSVSLMFLVVYGKNVLQLLIPLKLSIGSLKIMNDIEYFNTIPKKN